MKYNKVLLSCGFIFLFLALFSGVAFAETDVSGVTISEDTTWTADASPYIVHDDIYVAPGVTLTLEPGTIVKFDYGTNLYVFGNLIADGSVDAHVSLTSLYDDSVGGNTNMEESSTTDDASTPDDGSLTDVDESIDQITDPTPSIGDWQGVSIFDGGSYNFTDTDISYTNTAITSSNSSGNFSQVSVQHSQNGLDLMTSLISISQSNFSDIPGMFVQAFATSSVSIGSSNLEKIGKFGVVFDESSFSLQNSSIENMSAGTYDTLFTLFGTSTADIENSTVKYASGYVVFENFDNGNLTFASSTLMNISGNAAFVSFGDAGYATTSLIISNSDIATGTGNGLILFDKLNAQIQDTKIHGFSGNGIQADSYPVISIQGSSITNNTIGIRSVGSYLTAHGNVIENNSSWGIFAPNSQDFVDVQNNWWGDASGPQERFSNASGTSNGILDAPVSGGEGITNVTFAPWLESAPGTKQPCCSNVLFIPGIEASRLYDGNNNQIWEPGIVSNVPFIGQSHTDELMLDDSGEPVDTDVYTKGIIDHAYTNFFGLGNIYESFIDSMNGLVASGTISAWSAAPYDWRLSLQDIISKGKIDNNGHIYYGGFEEATSSPYIITELRQLAETSKTGKVTIIAHSNGGLVTKELTNILGPEASKLIDKIIFVAVPQVGTPEAIGSLLHGFDQGFPIPKAQTAFSADDARDLSKNMPGVYNLLPSAGYFSSVSTPVISFSATSSLLDVWRNTYSNQISSYDAFKDFLIHASDQSFPVKDSLFQPGPINTDLLQGSQDTHTSLDNWIPPTGIALYEIAGWGDVTAAGFTYKSDFVQGCPVPHSDSSTCPLALKEMPVLSYDVNTVVDGDGTVVVPSALWTATSTGAERYYVNLLEYNKKNVSLSIFNKSHSNILEIQELRSFLIQNLLEQSTETLPEYISTTSPIASSTDARLVFQLHSPLYLGVYDGDGNYTGVSSSTGLCQEEIFDSECREFGEVTYISVPASITAHVVMRGYASGSFSLDISQMLGTSTITSTTFAGIPSVTSTVASIDIPANSDITSSTILSVDEDGNGITDLSLAAEPNAVVFPDLSTQITPAQHPVTVGGGIPSYVLPVSTSSLRVVATALPADQSAFSIITPQPEPVISTPTYILQKTPQTPKVSLLSGAQKRVYEKSTSTKNNTLALIASADGSVAHGHVILVSTGIGILLLAFIFILL